jgi:hypothetical protein
MSPLLTCARNGCRNARLAAADQRCSISNVKRRGPTWRLPLGRARPAARSTRAAMTGHVTDASTEHYSHVEQAEKRAGVAQIAPVVSQSPGDRSGDAQMPLDAKERKSKNPDTLRA